VRALSTAFNGGNDVFVDVGNKSLGLQALQRYLGVTPTQVVHCGDRFTVTGNDNNGASAVSPPRRVWVR
jgi:IMP and pyridine-specific 5'-nucleotidase